MCLKGLGLGFLLGFFFLGGGVIFGVSTHFLVRKRYRVGLQPPFEFFLDPPPHYVITPGKGVSIVIHELYVLYMHTICLLYL